MHIAGFPLLFSQYVVPVFFREDPSFFEYFCSRTCILFCYYELVLYALLVGRFSEAKSWCLQGSVAAKTIEVRKR